MRRGQEKHGKVARARSLYKKRKGRKGMREKKCKGRIGKRKKEGKSERNRKRKWEHFEIG